MKRISLILLAILAVAMYSCQSGGASSISGGYSINATIEGATGKAILARPKGRQLEGIDTAVISNGKFMFKGVAEKEELTIVQLGEGMGAKYIYVFLENENIKLSGKLEDAQNATVTGGVNNTVWTGFTVMNKDFQSASSEISARYQGTKDSLEKQEIEAEYKKYEKTFIDTLVTFVKTNNDAVASVFIVSNILRNRLEFDELKEITDNIDGSIRDNEMAKGLIDDVQALENVKIGNVAPDFTMNDMSDTPVKMSSLIGNGYLLIDFWAAWCRPCRAENPNLVAAYNKYNAKGFEILGVSFDQQKDKWKEAVEADKLAWKQVSDLKYWENAAGKLYGVKSIPHNVLLDKEGKIIAKNLRGEELHAKLAELLD